MKWNLKLLLLWIVLSAVFISGGCLERQLTIKTQPSDALIELNDELIGITPVTISFNWYGDYNVRITKEGFQTLNTHRLLKAPWYDSFPFDFFAQILPEKRVDRYEWNFVLEPKKEVNQEKLLEDALKLKGQL